MSIPKGWQEVRLGDICDRVTTKNKEDCRNILTISAEYGFIRQDKFFTKVVASKDLSKYILLQRDDFVYNKSYSAGYPYGIFRRLKEDKGVATSLYIYFRFHTGNIVFLEYMFESGCLDLQLREIAQEGARNHGLLNVQVKDFFDLKIPYPPLKEQEKIAEILSSCDEYIKNLKNLKSELEKEKLHLMNELLSSKTRFANFTTPWQEVKLGDLGATYNGLSGKKAKDFEDGNSNYITYKNIFDNRVVKTSIFEKVKINDDEKQNLVKKGDVFFTTSSETPHEVGTSSVILEECENLYLNSFCFGFRPNESINSEYASFYFRSSIFREKLTKLAQGSTRYNLSKTEFLKIKIQLPSLEEQKKIGEVLSACDERLECLNELITAQTTLKSHLLTELLTGNIRVKDSE